MKALRWGGPNVMTCEQVPQPTPGPGEAVVSVHRVGICGSDVTAYRGRMGIVRPGDVRGHELAGIVTAVGDAADRVWVDAQVAANPIVTCGQCWACLRGQDNLCAELQIIGVHRPGAFAEQVVVPVVNLTSLSGMDFDYAATAEPLAQACHDVGLALPAQPEAVLIIGAGSIGSLVVQAVRLAEIDQITVVEPSSVRRVFAESVGASIAVDSLKSAGPIAGRRAQGGFDVVFDIVGAPQTRRAAVELTRNGGQVVLVGLHGEEGDLPWLSVVRREITVTGANCFTRADFDRAVSWLGKGRIRLSDDARYVALAEGPKVFAELAGDQPRGGKTYITPLG